jgi:secondary thiamine-phosphate synthase enzyme
MPRADLSLSTTRETEIVDVTEQVQGAVAETGVREGVALVSVAHCTCALYVNECEEGLLADTLRLAEELSRRRDWRHDSIDDNAAAHLAASLFGASVTLPVAGGRVELGTWQRILLLELDGPRRRRVTVQVIEDKS